MSMEAPHLEAMGARGLIGLRHSLAKALPFADGSIDLRTAACPGSASPARARPRSVKGVAALIFEWDRVVRPGGCLVQHRDALVEVTANWDRRFVEDPSRPASRAARPPPLRRSRRRYFGQMNATAQHVVELARRRWKTVFWQVSKRKRRASTSSSSALAGGREATRRLDRGRDATSLVRHWHLVD